MNKVILMGRLTKDPETRFSQSATPVAVTRYGIAVRRQFAKQGEQDVDFFNIVAFGKSGEFAEKYFKKGQMVAVVGKLKNDTWEDDNKVKHTSVTIIVEEQHFAGSKSDNPSTQEPASNSNSVTSGFNIVDDDDLPF